MARTVWFPGHMAKGTRKLSELSGKLDLLLEVRDARAPEATSSPMVRNLSREILVWTILAKRDLAAEETTKEWLRFFEKRGGKAWALNLLAPKVDTLRRALVSVAPPHREVRLAVVGIPNVGKSLLLNALVGKSLAKVGGIPGITRGVAWYKGSGLLVVDSPGILDPHSGEIAHRKLAWLGCSKADVIGGFDVVAMELITFLKTTGRWKLIFDAWGVPDEEESADEALERIGRRLGCLVAGGRVDIEQAGRRLVDAFSRGALGPVSLESPEEDA